MTLIFSTRALLLALTISTHTIPAAFAATPEEVCPSIGEMAANIMRARQSGAIMSTSMAAVPADSALKGLAIELVKKAYAVPQYRVGENREQAVIEFRNDTELECYTNGD